MLVGCKGDELPRKGPFRCLYGNLSFLILSSWPSANVYCICRWCFASWLTYSVRKSWQNDARTTHRSTYPPTSPSANFSRVYSDATTRIIELFPRRRRRNFKLMMAMSRRATASAAAVAAAAAMQQRRSRAPSCSSPSCCAARWHRLRPRQRRRTPAERQRRQPPTRRHRVTALHLLPTDHRHVQRLNHQVHTSNCFYEVFTGIVPRTKALLATDRCPPRVWNMLLL